MSVTIFDKVGKSLTTLNSTLLAELHHRLRVLCASVFQIQTLLVFSHRLFDFDFWKHRVTVFTEENQRNSPFLNDTVVAISDKCP